MSVAVKVFDRRMLVFAACAVVACLMVAHFLSIGTPGTQYRQGLVDQQECIASLQVNDVAWPRIMLVNNVLYRNTAVQPACPAVAAQPLYESIDKHGAQIFVTVAGLLLVMVLFNIFRQREE